MDEAFVTAARLPDPQLYSCSEAGIERLDYEAAESVRLTQAFLQARERFLYELFAD